MGSRPAFKAGGRLGKIDRQSMQKELQELEKKYSIDWREYKIGELFDNIQQGARLTKADQKKGNIPFIMAGVTNTGIVDCISNPVRKFPKNSLTVDIFGNTFYRSFDFGASDDVGVFWNSDNRFTEKTMRFISVLIEKRLFKRFDYGKKLRASQTHDIKILLPTANNQIAFAYIKEFLATLDAERLATLDAYLIATNLKDYILTEEENRAFVKLKDVKWRKFRLDNLFEIFTGRDFIMMTSVKGNIPVISRSSTNNGFGVFSEKVAGQKLFNHKETITATLIGKIWSTVHNQDFYLGTRVKGLVVKDKSISHRMLQFITVAINKIGCSYVTYQNKPEEFENLSVNLPVKHDSTPDFDFIEIYIKAIQKIVIKNVIEWLDKRISKTKEVIISP